MDELIKEICCLPKANIMWIDRYIREVSEEEFDRIPIAEDKVAEVASNYGMVFLAHRDGYWERIYCVSPSLFREGKKFKFDD